MGPSLKDMEAALIEADRSLHLARVVTLAHGDAYDVEGLHATIQRGDSFSFGVDDPTDMQATFVGEVDGRYAYYATAKAGGRFGSHAHLNAEFVRVIAGGTLVVNVDGAETRLVPGDPEFEIPPGAKHWARALPGENVDFAFRLEILSTSQN